VWSFVDMKDGGKRKIVKEGYGDLLEQDEKEENK